MVTIYADKAFSIDRTAREECQTLFGNLRRFCWMFVDMSPSELEAQLGEDGSEVYWAWRW